MKRSYFVFAAGFVLFTFSSCHTGITNKNINTDTAVKTATDTTVIPGSPGPSGSQPGPGDTTQAHNDSLKRAVHIADSSGKSGSAK